MGRGNRGTVAAMARFNLGRYLFLTWQKAGDAQRSHEEHRELLRLCEAGDGAGTVRRVQAHNRATGEPIAGIRCGGWAARIVDQVRDCPPDIVDSTG